MLDPTRNMSLSSLLISLLLLVISLLLLVKYLLLHIITGEMPIIAISPKVKIALNGDYLPMIWAAGSHGSTRSPS